MNAYSLISLGLRFVLEESIISQSLSIEANLIVEGFGFCPCVLANVPFA